MFGNKVPIIGFRDVNGFKVSESDSEVLLMVISDGSNPEAVDVEYFFISGTVQGMPSYSLEYVILTVPYLLVADTLHSKIVSQRDKILLVQEGHLLFHQDLECILSTFPLLTTLLWRLTNNLCLDCEQLMNQLLYPPALLK